MVEELAEVVAVTGNHITVRSEIKSSCHSCSQADNCGSGQIAKAIPHKSLVVEIKTQLLVKVGDKVVIGLPEDQLLTSAMQVYLLPLVGLISAALCGQWLFDKAIINHELIAIALSFFGGFLGFRLAKYLQQKKLSCAKHSAWLSPQILRVLPSTIKVKQVS